MLVPLKYNLRSLRTRWVGSLMTVASVALVVWASVLSLGLAAGLRHALAVSGDPLDLMVLRKGATAETQSIVGEPKVRELLTLPGIAKNEEGRPLASPELVVVVNTPRREFGSSNLVIRGVTPLAASLRPGFKVQGAWPQPGLRQAIAGGITAERFANCKVGESLKVGGHLFEVVGTFEAGDSAAESEVWTNLDVLAQSTSREGVVSAVQLRAASPADAEKLKNRVEDDAQFGLSVVPETKYFADQALTTGTLSVVGMAISLVLVVGAMFAVANTMYGAVAGRAREIGTLRSLGFGRFAVLLSFLLESVLLALIGGAIGCLLALPLRGLRTGTANWATFSELSFEFRLDAWVFAAALALVIVMGALGGFFPALRATRLRIVDALREV